MSFLLFLSLNCQSYWYGDRVYQLSDGLSTYHIFRMLGNLILPLFCVLSLYFVVAFHSLSVAHWVWLISSVLRWLVSLGGDYFRQLTVWNMVIELSHFYVFPTDIASFCSGTALFFMSGNCGKRKRVLAEFAFDRSFFAWWNVSLDLGD